MIVSSRTFLAVAGATATLMACDAILGDLTDRRADAETDTGVRPALGFVGSASTFGTDSIHTEPTDTQGASLFVAAVCTCCGSNAPPSPTDSMSNVWVRMHPYYYADAASLQTTIEMFYVEAPQISTDQVFFLESKSGTNSSLVVLSFSGTAQTFDASGAISGRATATSSSETIQPGALNPAEDEVAVTFACGGISASEATIDDGFHVAQYQHGLLGKGVDIAAAYRLAPDAQVHPTWSLPGDTRDLESMIGLFRGAH